MSNLCLAYLKTNDYVKCVETANQALEIDTNNVKVYYRRANAYLLQNSFEEAESDFNKVLELDPLNEDAKNDL